jgi:hypothetical protein
MPTAKPPAELERDFARWLNDAAKMFGWRFAHFRPARTKYGWVTPMEGDDGWPDYVLVRPPRLIIAELKRLRRPSEVNLGQKVWLDQLDAVPGVEVYLWTPDQRDEILLCLALEQSPASLEAVRDKFRELTREVVVR